MRGNCRGRYSMASSVALDSDYPSDEDMGHLGSGNVSKRGSRLLLPNNTSNFITITEGSEIENSDREEAEELVRQTSTLAKGKSRRARKGKGKPSEASKPAKLLKIDSLLLRPDNQPKKDHHMTQSSGQYSFMDEMEDMEMQMPEPTAVEKLKYHLTEARLPPTRRKTYNYSHI